MHLSHSMTLILHSMSSNMNIRTHRSMEVRSIQNTLLRRIESMQIRELQNISTRNQRKQAVNYNIKNSNRKLNNKLMVMTSLLLPKKSSKQLLALMIPFRLIISINWLFKQITTKPNWISSPTKLGWQSNSKKTNILKKPR